MAMRELRPEAKESVPKPKGMKDVPRYIKEITKAFFTRLFYIFALVWETRKSLMFLMLFISVFTGLMPVAGSLIGAEILNRLARVYSGEDIAFAVVAVLIIWQFVYLIVNSGVQRLYSMITSITGELVANHVKMKIMEKAKSVDVMSYDDPDFYSSLENANREAGMRPMQIMSQTNTVISIVISMISFIAVIFAASRVAPLIIIIAAVPTAVINFIYRKKNVDYIMRRSKARRQMEYYSTTITDKDLVKEVRMFSLGDVLIKKYSETFKGYFSGLRKLKIQEFLWMLGAALVTNVVYCLFYIYLARGVYNGVFQVGDFSLYSGAVNTLGIQVGNFIVTTASIYEGTLFIDNLMRFLGEKQTVVPTIPEPAHVSRHVGHTLEARNVSFSYPGSDRLVLKNISVTIKPGETVSIVGLNGAGKTTFIKLLTRLYDPTEGVILLDGRDIREYDVSELYDMYGIIFQDFGKYAVSVRENIAFGDLKKQVSDEDIRKAAENSGASAYIDTLEKGYDTPLMKYFEESGTELSIGQWQKLAIARAFYADSDVLILDEPTASLDPMAEQDIFNRFNELRRDKTSIFISHRLSSATTADTILVMENGEIVERGSHKELMRLGRKYHELFSTQAARYIDSQDGEE